MNNLKIIYDNSNLMNYYDGLIIYKFKFQVENYSGYLDVDLNFNLFDKFSIGILDLFTNFNLNRTIDFYDMKDYIECIKVKNNFSL
ncbi:MAG: hypothetical protein HRU03_04820 [Nanoarchaeales archaeon]|nr:hypothetical protein [Nanoarchaeales archaeon]